MINDVELVGAVRGVATFANLVLMEVTRVHRGTRGLQGAQSVNG